MQALFGQTHVRKDEWVLPATRAVQLGSIPKEAATLIASACESLRGPLFPQALLDAWQAVSSALQAAPEVEIVAELAGRFVWRYFPQLSSALGDDRKNELSAVRHAVSQFAGLGEVSAGLLVAGDGTKVPEAVNKMRAAAQLRPKDTGLALRLGVALAGVEMDKSHAINLLLPHVRESLAEKKASNAAARLLAAFAFLAATGGGSEAQKLVMPALELAARQKASRGSALAALYGASLKGSVDFAQCERAFQLERDLLFAPGDCFHIVELAVLLRGATKVPAAIAEGSRLLRGLPFDCLAEAEKLSGLGKHWLEATNRTAGIYGLASNLYSVADIRQGIRDASYVAWDQNVAKGQKIDSKERWGHVDVFQAAVSVNRLQDESLTIAKRQKCKQLPKQHTLAKPSIEDELKCLKVSPDQFARKCLQQHRPCILSGQANSFLRQRDGTSSLDRWVKLAGNASIRVSFPFPPTFSEGIASLNNIEETTAYFQREEVHRSLEEKNMEAPTSSEFPWTLVRPAQWNMRLSDAVTWARSHPQDIYMNQQMLADLGGIALNELNLPQWVVAAGLRLLSPSLWFASGAVVTGYHYDGPENLLVQLEGDKEVILLRPSAMENLYYMATADVEADVRLQDDGSARVAGLRVVNRSTSGHSVIDVANAQQAAQFPLYAQAAGVNCKVGAGDVLYIPSFWHHAVATTPNENCTGLSLNLWFYHPDQPSDVKDAVSRCKLRRP